MKKLLMLAAIAAVLGACSQDKPYGPSNDGEAISFNPYASNSLSKAATDNTSIQTSGWNVFGYFHDNGTIDWSAATPNFMFNQAVTYSSGAWTYTPIKYWSNDASDKYSFFGYAPTTSTYIAAKSTNTTAGAPVVTYTLNTTTPADAVDFVAGQFVGTDKATSAAAGVTINMKHQLTRLGFEAKNEVTTNSDASTFVVVRLISLAGSSTLKTHVKGDYKFATTTTDGTANVHTQDGTWDYTDYTAEAIEISKLLDKDNGAYGSGTPYPANVGKAIPANGTAYVSLFGTDTYQYILPPAGATGLPASSGMELTIVYDIVTVDPAVANGYTYSRNQVKIPIGDAGLKQGISYKYQITFKLTEVILDANVVDWDTTDGTVDTDGTETTTSGVPTAVDPATDPTITTP